LKNLSICIDIDGTITDPYYWLEGANEYFKKSVEPFEITEYSIDKSLGISEGAYSKFYAENKFKIHTEEAVREDAVQVVKKLFEENSIYFVTARSKELEMLTYSYLNTHGVPYDDVFVLGTTHKVEKAQELQCDVFIEDSYENAQELSKAGFKVLLVDTTYNRQPACDNMTRVFSWSEIYSIIRKMLMHTKAV
jgi:hypothetical protein